MTIARQEKSIFDQIPSAQDRPEEALPSRVAMLNPRWSRRRVFGMALGAVTAAGLGALDLLPGARPRSAAAQVYTSIWTDGCHGYATASAVCSPASAYFGPGNCTIGNWHRDNGDTGTCYSAKYTSKASTCDGRNAWRWNGGSTSSLKRKCSDGEYYYVTCGSTGTTRFSICRTAI
ncbi:hypothetical protein [Microtetraspora malaysiensis]|uniref:hypothetical protein n=1 Tax=Microtetraspora malaysiensis TaxID=161358 RepID=UPI003D8CE033